MTRYLTIDGEIGGTGIRDWYDGAYVEAEALGLPPALVSSLRAWLLEYAEEHYNGFSNEESVQKLDREGIRLSSEIKTALGDCKVSYFSNGKLIRILIE